MIPLRSTDDLKKFPKSTLIMVIFLAIVHFISYLWPGDRQNFLIQVAVDSHSSPEKFLSALLFHHHLFSLFVSLIYLWVFAPKVIERWGFFPSLGISLVCSEWALFSFRLIHSESSAPFLGPEAYVGAVLGLFMRRDIWGTVSTFVIGFGWARIYEVPSYVLLFFWFFYLLLGNLFLKPPFADAPMLYWIPFISFLSAFAMEALLTKILKKG